MGARDHIILAAFFVVSMAPVPFEAARTPTAGPAARVAMSWERINHRALDERTLPLWNPYQFGGRPHLANPEMLSLYPPHVLLRALPLPLFFAASFALHAWLAAAGTYLTVLLAGLPRSAAIAATGAVLCGRLFIPLEDVAYSLELYRLAWLPLIAACVLRSAARRTWLPRPKLVAVAALGVLAAALDPTYVLATVVGSYAFSAMWPSSHGSSRHLIAQPVILALLTAGLTAFQSVPTLRFRTTMTGGNEVVPDVPPRTSADGGSTQQYPEIANTLRSLEAHGRVLSTCDRAIDGADFVALDAPGIGGYGGVFLADYARFVSLARGPQQPIETRFEGIPEIAGGFARADLLHLLGIEYLVSCAPVDSQRWTPVVESQGVTVSRSLSPPLRAFWTCEPRAVGRQEMEFRLRQSSYDRNLVLQPNAIIHVRWPEGLSDGDRARLESALHLAPQRDIGDRTWQYNLLERSRENIAAIVAHPSVEDTSGLDRSALVLSATAIAIPPFDEPKSDWLMGAEACEAPVAATVQIQDRMDGTMRVDVDAPRDGIVFFSETFYPERRAEVDGRRAPRLKVNMAFTGVRVSAGHHRIELRYDARVFWIGFGVSLLAAIAWLESERRVRTRA